MTEPEIAVRDGAITLADTAPDPARNPYWTYLARMNSAESRRTMQGCLDRLAAALSADADAGDHPGQLVQWHRLRYQHVIMIRAAHEPGLVTQPRQQAPVRAPRRAEERVAARADDRRGLPPRR